MMAEMKEFRIINSGKWGLYINGGHCAIMAPLFTGFVSGKQDAEPCSVSIHPIWRDIRDHHPGQKPRGLGLPQVWGHHPGKHHPQSLQLPVSEFRLQSQKDDVQGGTGLVSPYQRGVARA